MYHGGVFALAWLKQSNQLVRHLSLQSTARLSYARHLSCAHQTGGMRAMATSAREPHVKKRVVAGSFIFKIPNGDEKQAKVALFRRSSKVSTYQHKLAPCSGSVEESDASPLDAALREIEEETRLPASSLDLLRVGKPYSFSDESINRVWNINPFAFRLKDVAEGGKGEEGITLDWEHDGIEWFDPMQVNGSDEFGGVPRLVDSLRRVWPEYDLGADAARILTDGLQTLRDDHERGARELAGVAVSTLRDVIRQMLLSHPIDEDSWSKVRMAAWHICQSRPSMGAAITSAIIKALYAIKPIYTAEMIAAIKTTRITQLLEEQLAQRYSTTDRIYLSFVDYVRQNVLRGEESKQSISVLTLSSSSTITSCLLKAAACLGVGLDLHILESRPLFEGVAPASRILKETPQSPDIKITLYSDASAALAARNVDLVLLGADRISSAGDVSNKIGSLPAVLSARHVAPNAKVLVLSDTEKIAGPGSTGEHVSEQNSPRELTRAWKGVVSGAQVIENALSQNDPKISVKNVYFEWVPAGLIDAYITEDEDGVLTTEQIRHKSEWIGNEIEQFFGGL
ncbi:hypothetical protein F4678DRAFT_443337 [Xylaria arbuscula]|nr:hypothetical protein F4678DRAFT_443337 [Xylaria arbuscula]